MDIDTERWENENDCDTSSNSRNVDEGKCHQECMTTTTGGGFKNVNMISRNNSGRYVQCV